jgi:acetolactate synthase-1/2/3 large subunit
VKSAVNHELCDHLVRELEARDVRAVFGVMGDDTAALLAAVDRQGIGYIAARHENQAVAMADGYWRATGRVGVAAVTGGPGFTHALTAINTARRGRSGIVVLVGAVRPLEDDLDPALIRSASRGAWLKHFPQADVCEAAGIPVMRPTTGEDLASSLSAALTRAQTGKTVVLIISRDVLADDVPASIVRAAEPEPLAPEPNAIMTLADVLQETWAVSRPLILAGRGAVTSGAGPALRRLADLTGALLATTLPAKGLFNGDAYDLGVCGTYSTPVATGLIRRADAVLAFGASLNMATSADGHLLSGTLIVQVDADPKALGLFFDVELGVCADVRTTAEALVVELERRDHRPPAAFRAEASAAGLAEFDPADEVVDAGTEGAIDPRMLMLELDRLLPPGRILSLDAGQHAKFMVRYVGVEQPRNFMQAVDAGSIGLGLGTGIGAAVARPGEVVVVGIGDAGLMMSLGDLETAVRYRLPLVIVVSNDQALGSEMRILQNMGLPPDLADIPTPSLAETAVALGGEGVEVTRLDQLEPLHGRLHATGAGPLLLDCRISREVLAD